MARHRTYLLVVFFCASVLAVGPGPGLFAQAKQDVMTHSPFGPSGCYNFFLMNQNAQNLDIDQITLRILTPGFLWYSRTKAPTSWTVNLPVPETLHFTGSVSPVPPGGKITLNSVCLDAICSSVSSVEVVWQTFHGTTLLTIDTLLLTCIPLDQYDAVSARDSAGISLLTLYNRNSATLPLDEFSVRSLTQGISISARTNNSWIVGNSSSTHADFAKTTATLFPGDSLSGFVLTVTNNGSAFPPYVFEWSTAFESRTITTSDLLLGKGDPIRDSVRFHSFQTSPDGRFNSLGFTLRNIHRPSGPIDKLELILRTPGIAFADSNSGPWAPSNPGGTALRFTAGAVPLTGQDSLPGFRIALVNPGEADSVTIIWISYYQGQTISRDTVVQYCPPTVFFGCDNFSILMDKSCLSSIHISNRHLPASPVNGFTFEIISGMESILSVVPAVGWETDSSNSSVVHFVHPGGGLTPGNVTLPFEIAFSSVQPGRPYNIRWSTWYNGRLICSEERDIVCRAAETSCDTLLVSTDGARKFTYNIKNQHLPATSLTTISFSVSAGNSALRLLTTPASWAADSTAADYLRFVHQSGGTAPGGESGGFELEFIENTATDVTLEWCTEDSNSVICCQSIPVTLPEWRTCDSLAISKDPAVCTSVMTLSNIHDSQTPIDRLSISLVTPGREIDTIIAPSGWNAVLVDAANASFEHASGGLPAGSVQTGFSVRLVPGSTGRDVEFEWCTWSGNSTICCARDSIPCAASESGRCDSTQMEAGISCCFELSVLNLRGPDALVDSVQLLVLTPDVILYPSTAESPFGWIFAGTDTDVSWSTATFPIVNGFLQGSFRVCFDNDAIGNADFLVQVNTYDRSGSVCIDTLLSQCDQTLVVGGGPVPSAFTLEQNFPNPFNPSTTLVFGMQQSGFITLDILDARGKLISTVAEGFHEAGRHRVEFDASSLPSGVYFGRLWSGTQSVIRAMTLLR
ncbi:MAG: hypothetical protein WC824_07100 [Bacteroidota bacterium]